MKRFFYVVGAVCICLLVLIIFLPTLAGSNWITKPIIERLARDRFDLSIDSVKLRWLSPLEFRGITVKQDGEVPLLTIQAITTNRSLLGYLFGGRNLGQVVVEQPTVDVALLSDGSNLSKFVDAIRGAEEAGRTDLKSKPLFDVAIAIRGFNAKVQKTSSDTPLVVVPPFDADLSYQATQGTTHLFVEPTTLLKGVELRPELLELGLAYAIPVLAKSAWFDGKISLSVGKLDINLDKPIDSLGDAKFTLHQVRSGPSDPQIIALLGMIARMRGKEPIQEIVFVDGSQIEITVVDQKVHHKGLAFGLPKVDPRLQIASSGSVDMVNRMLDIEVQVPVPIENMARRDAVKALGVPTIGIPIRGTLDEPKPDWLALRNNAGILLGSIQDSLQEEAPGMAAFVGAVEGLANGEADQVIGAATDIAKELIERRRKAKEAELNGETPTSNGAPIRDALRGWLQNRSKPVEP